ncbi:MAG: adenine deaminase [Candidatus Dadabacteria bacterium]|nr:MAG: adenine deaminase [Candidatus Dadabacteria bacterium]
MKDCFEIEGQIVDPLAGRIFSGRVYVESGRIKRVSECKTESRKYITPGLVDAHVHVESSMLVPTEFARLAVIHGTVATVSDPHEIANVLGLAGVEFMLENARRTLFKFAFGAPSCVPATPFETSGAILDSADVRSLLERDDIYYLSEMMNYPGVLSGDPEVMAKIRAARDVGKPVDGHAPGLTGDDVLKYAGAGISTDHECFTKEEALSKIKAGMKILIREGSAARNFSALIELLDEYPDSIMFCSDDKHPDDLIAGHINSLLARAVAAGRDPLVALKAATVNPVQHYRLPVGLLREGDPADFVVFSDLEKFQVEQTFIDGICVAECGKALLEPVQCQTPNVMACSPLNTADIKVSAESGTLRAIEVIDGELITNEIKVPAAIVNGEAVSDSGRDLLKLVVINRYRQEKPAVAFVKNFGLKKGALASTVAHDCHNIIAVGTNDNDIVSAVNGLIESGGGVSAAEGNRLDHLALPVAGLMSAEDGHTVAELYKKLDARAKELGSTLRAPFMSLSFLALLVIPKLKLGDRGLFDGESFEFVPLFV